MAAQGGARQPGQPVSCTAAVHGAHDGLVGRLGGLVELLQGEQAHGGAAELVHALAQGALPHMHDAHHLALGLAQACCQKAG